MTARGRLLPALGFAASLLAAGVAAPVAHADDAGGASDGWRLHPYGWVEGTLSTSPLTESRSRTARVFDVEDEGFRFHQVYLALERLPKDGACFDIGGRVAVLWGTDARFTHARGLLDTQTEREQFDLLEAHLLVKLPVAEGLTLKIGKCTTPMGFEVIEAQNNLLPSRSFLFGYAIPFTHTGAIATLQLSAQWSLSYGLVQGWDVWDDNNSAWTHLATVAYTSPSKSDALAVNGIVGAERPGNNNDLRTVVDGTWTHTWSDAWKTTLNGDFGTEQGAAGGGRDAAWWGAAGYITRKWNDALSGTLRAEYFRDRDGTRLGAAATLSGATFGLDWTPSPSAKGFHVRPELRWDHSFDGAFFDNGQDRDQWSFAVDILFTF